MNNNQNNINLLIELEKKTYINILKKNKLTNIINIINDCDKMKKKKVVDLSNKLRNLSGNMIDTEKLKMLYEIFLDDIDNINNIINIINKDILLDETFIEIYGN